jgi:hypothetical protein
LFYWFTRSPECPLQFSYGRKFCKALPLLPESLNFIRDARRCGSPPALTESLNFLGDIPVTHWIV